MIDQCLPQDLSEMSGGLEAPPGVARHETLSEDERAEHTFPIEQGENVVTVFCETGDLRQLDELAIGVLMELGGAHDEIRGRVARCCAQGAAHGVRICEGAPAGTVVDRSEVVTCHL